MSRASRALRIALPLAVLLAAGGHTALWFWAAAALERGVVANLAAPLAPGWRVGGGPLLRHGWPWRVAVTVPDLVVAYQAPEFPDGITWSAERLEAHVALLRPGALLLDVAGRQALRLGSAPPVPVAAERMRATVPLVPGAAVGKLDVEVVELRAELPGGAVGLARLSLHGETMPGATQAEPALAVRLEADEVTLPPPPPGQAWALGPRITQVALDATLSGPVPRLAGLAERATAWRDGGGALEVRRLALHWGSLRLTGSATLALDARLQPAGAATARMSGHAEALDALTAVQVLAPRGAMAAKAVLALMTRPAPDGGPPMVEVPFTLQDRTLALGRIPLVRLPQLVWPAGR